MESNAVPKFAVEVLKTATLLLCISLSVTIVSVQAGSMSQGLASDELTEAPVETSHQQQQTSPSKQESVSAQNSGRLHSVY